MALLSIVSLSACSLLRQEPVLSGASLYDLHDSADRVRWERGLSSQEFAELDSALDVLVGAEARQLVERIERSPRKIAPAVRVAAEARVLAPLEGMSFEQAVGKAVEKMVDQRTALQAELRAEKAAAPRSRRQLGRIEVARAAYWTSVATGEHAIDFVIRNGSDREIEGLLLDCRLVDTRRRTTRERGTCRVDFGIPLLPGMSTEVTAGVEWESRQHLGWVVEARPIRAYGSGGLELWEVPSALDRSERGRVARLESRIAALDDRLVELGVDDPTLRRALASGSVVATTAPPAHDSRQARLPPRG